MKIDINKLKVEKLNLNRLNQYLELYENVKKCMKYPEWLGDFSRDDYIHLLNNGSTIFIWIYNKKIIAAGMLIPSKEKDLIKFFSQDLNYKEVIDFGPELVDINYIGNGLQDKIIKYLEKYAKEKGYRYGISTVHPDNFYSIRNLEKNEFKNIGTIELKRGTRNVYRKQL